MKNRDKNVAPESEKSILQLTGSSFVLFRQVVGRTKELFGMQCFKLFGFAGAACHQGK